VTKGRWNYRVIDFGDHLALHEVHYEDGKPVAYTEGPATFVTDNELGLVDLLGSLDLASGDAKSRPVLPVGEIGKASK
jgi:hypothetical protein